MKKKIITELPQLPKSKLYDALRKMGKKHLKKQYKDLWTPEHPTTGYCYVIAEVVYHYLAPEGSKPYMMRINEYITHWYVKFPDGAIVDLSAEQFNKLVSYTGEPRNFMTKEPSKRAKTLAELLGLC